MKTLERGQIDGLVRQLEARAYRLALEFVHDRETADDALLEAFGRAAPFFPRLPSEQLKAKVGAAIRAQVSDNGSARKTADGIAAIPVSASLHARLVDVVEEGQNDEPVGRRKLVFAALAGTLLLVAGIAYAAVRIDALAAARPMVAETNPPAGATGVPVQGTFTVRFTRSPSTKPSLSLSPSNGSLDRAIWGGGEVIVGYGGLRLATNYTLTVKADYRSTYNDIGHFVQGWRFTTEGYPILTNLDPANGAAGAFRTGEFSIEFNHQPPVDPVVSVSPSDASFDPGIWVGSTWIVRYSGLKPLTTYQATVAVDYGVPSANLRRSWSFTTEVGAPPAGAPVIWYVAGSRNTPPVSGPQRLIALDWGGNVVGTAYLANVLRQTWDGSLLMDQSGSFDDPNGNVVRSTGTYPAVAEDSRTLCELADANGALGRAAQSLFVGPITGQLRRIAPVDASNPSNSGLISCSVSGNRALLSEGQIRGISAMSVFALNSGRLLYRHTYPVYPTAITPARDSRYVAEQISTINDQGVVTSW